MVYAMPRTLLVSFLVLAACTGCGTSSGHGDALPANMWRDPVSGVQLGIRAVDVSPNGDHGRRLIVVARNGGVSELGLCSWPGGDANVANVYRMDDGGLTVVDMNGMWLELSAIGEVGKVVWRWGEPLPDNGVGCFRHVGHGIYDLQSQLAERVYWFKDPPR
jgi:hypothetical protein